VSGQNATGQNAPEEEVILQLIVTKCILLYGLETLVIV